MGYSGRKMSSWLLGRPRQKRGLQGAYRWKHSAIEFTKSRDTITDTRMWECRLPGPTVDLQVRGDSAFAKSLQDTQAVPGHARYTDGAEHPADLPCRTACE